MTRKISLVLGLIILLAGCGKSTPTNYYTLTANSALTTQNNLPKTTLRVARVAIPQYLDRDAVVSRNDAVVLKVDSVQVWAEPLGDGLRRVLQNQLAPELLERNITVLPLGSEDAGTYTLLVDILRLDGEFNGQAQLQAQWSVITSNTNHSLADGIFVAQETIQGNTYEDLVRGFSKLTQRLASHISQNLSGLNRKKR